MVIVWTPVAWLTFTYDACGQSQVVFMTSDNRDFDSRLHRFDAGVESFAISVGVRPAFEGVTVLNGEVLVADYRADQIQRFAPKGSYLGAFAPFEFPTFLESDSSGNVYTTSGEFRINPVRLSSVGLGTQTFNISEYTRGIDADAAGNVYIAKGGTAGTHQLFKFASNGSLLNSIPLGAINPADLSIDETSKLLYLADQSGGSAGIRVFDISGDVPSMISSIFTPVDSRIGGVHFAAESGNILAVDFGLGAGSSNDPRGLEFSPSGALLREYRPANTLAAFDITTLAVPEPATWMLLAGSSAWLLMSCPLTGRHREAPRGVRPAASLDNAGGVYLPHRPFY
jgi:hypothetical protein